MVLKKYAILCKKYATLIITHSTLHIYHFSNYIIVEFFNIYDINCSFLYLYSSCKIWSFRAYSDIIDSNTLYRRANSVFLYSLWSQTNLFWFRFRSLSFMSSLSRFVETGSFYWRPFGLTYIVSCDTFSQKMTNILYKSYTSDTKLV